GGREPSRHAQFVYVAATLPEIENDPAVAGVWDRLDAYGNEADDWRPFYPNPDAPAYVLAQSAATLRRFKYERIPLGPDLIDRLRQARDARRIVVLVVDCRSLKLGRYQRAMEDYVGTNFINSVVVVPWDKGHERPEDAKELEALLN